MASLERYKEKDEMLFRAIEKLQAGDTTDINLVYELSEKYIKKIINDIVKDYHATEDLMQETYIRVYNNIDSLKDVTAFYSWAGHIATNLTLRYLQKNRHEVLAVADEEGSTDFVFENAAEDCTEEFIPESVLEDKEAQRLIGEILQGLPEAQYLAVQYFYFEEMSVKAIAEEMECSEGTVKSRLNYARQAIKQAVIDLDVKKGTRLYSMAALPVFWLVFRSSAENVAAAELGAGAVLAETVADGAAQTGVTTTGTTATVAGTTATVAGTTASVGTFGMAAGLKTLIIVLISVLSLGGAGVAANSNFDAIRQYDNILEQRRIEREKKNTLLNDNKELVEVYQEMGVSEEQIADLLYKADQHDFMYIYEEANKACENYQRMKNAYKNCLDNVDPSIYESLNEEVFSVLDQAIYYSMIQTEQFLDMANKYYDNESIKALVNKYYQTLLAQNEVYDYGISTLNDSDAADVLATYIAVGGDLWTDLESANLPSILVTLVQHQIIATTDEFYSKTAGYLMASDNYLVILADYMEYATSNADILEIGEKYAEESNLQDQEWYQNMMSFYENLFAEIDL